MASKTTMATPLSYQDLKIIREALRFYLAAWRRDEHLHGPIWEALNKVESSLRGPFESTKAA